MLIRALVVIFNARFTNTKAIIIQYAKTKAIIIVCYHAVYINQYLQMYDLI